MYLKSHAIYIEDGTRFPYLIFVFKIACNIEDGPRCPYLIFVFKISCNIEDGPRCPYLILSDDFHIVDVISYLNKRHYMYKSRPLYSPFLLRHPVQKIIFFLEILRTFSKINELYLETMVCTKVQTALNV